MKRLVYTKTPSVEEVLNTSGFHWDHSDSRGFNVYVRTPLAIRLYTDPSHLIEEYISGALNRTYTPAEFIQKYRVPSEKTDTDTLPNSLLSYSKNKKTGEIDVEYNGEEIGSYPDVPYTFGKTIPSIQAYFLDL